MVDQAPAPAPAAQSGIWLLWFFAGMALFYCIALVFRSALYRIKNGKFSSVKAAMNVWVIQPCDSCCAPAPTTTPPPPTESTESTESPAPQEIPAIPAIPAIATPSENYMMKTEVEHYLIHGDR